MAPKRKPTQIIQPQINTIIKKVEKEEGEENEELKKSNYFELLFWKVFRNGYLFSEIFEKIHSTEWIIYEKFQQYHFLNRIKFKYILSLDLMIEKKLFQLLKCKLIANEQIEINIHSLTSFLSIKNNYFETSNTSFKELFQLLLLKNKSNELLSSSVVKLSVKANNIEALGILVNQPYNYQIPESSLLLVECNSSTFSFILSSYQKQNQIVSDDFKNNFLKELALNGDTIDDSEYLKKLSILLDNFPDFYNLPKDPNSTTTTTTTTTKPTKESEKRVKKIKTKQQQVDVTDWKINIRIEKLDEFEIINKLADTGIFIFNQFPSFENIDSNEKLICFLKIIGFKQEMIDHIILDIKCSGSNNNNNNNGTDLDDQKLFKELSNQLILNSTQQWYFGDLILWYLNKYDEFEDNHIRNLKPADISKILKYCVQNFSTNILNWFVKNFNHLDHFINGDYYIKKSDNNDKVKEMEKSRYIDFIGIYTSLDTKYHNKKINDYIFDKKDKILEFNQDYQLANKSISSKFKGFKTFPLCHESLDNRLKFAKEISLGNIEKLKTLSTDHLNNYYEKSNLSKLSNDQLLKVFNFLNDNDIFSKFNEHGFLSFLNQFFKCYYNNINNNQQQQQQQQQHKKPSLSSLGIKINFNSIAKNTIYLLLNSIGFFYDKENSEDENYIFLCNPDNVELIFNNFDLHNHIELLESIVEKKEILREIVGINFKVCTKKEIIPNFIESIIKFLQLFFEKSYLNIKSSEKVIKFINVLYASIIQTKYISKEIVKKVFKLLTDYAFPVEQTLFHSFFYLHIKSPKFIKYILQRPGMDYFLECLGGSFEFYDCNDPESMQTGDEEDEYYFNIKRYLDPSIFTFNFIFNNSFDHVLEMLVNKLSLTPIDEKLTCVYGYEVGARNYLNDKLNKDLEYFLTIRRVDLFFKHLEFIQSLLDKDGFKVGGFPNKVETNLFSSSLYYIGDNNNNNKSNFDIGGPFKYFKISENVIGMAIFILNLNQLKQFIQFNKYYPSFINILFNTKNYYELFKCSCAFPNLTETLDFILNNYHYQSFDPFFNNGSTFISNKLDLSKLISLSKMEKIKNKNNNNNFQINNLLSSIIISILSKPKYQKLYKNFIKNNENKKINVINQTIDIFNKLIETSRHKEDDEENEDDDDDENDDEKEKMDEEDDDEDENNENKSMALEKLFKTDNKLIEIIKEKFSNQVDDKQFKRLFSDYSSLINNLEEQFLKANQRNASKSNAN
ncbi:hypothetical protein ACTFIR_006636 [Dictyostelium discoideum]